MRTKSKKLVDTSHCPRPSINASPRVTRFRRRHSSNVQINGQEADKFNQVNTRCSQNPRHDYSRVFKIGKTQTSRVLRSSHRNISARGADFKLNEESDQQDLSVGLTHGQGVNV